MAEAPSTYRIEIPYPQPGPQADLLSLTACPEIGYGGARGGGKTAGTLLDYLQDVPKYGKAWRGIIFRKTYSELEDVINQAKDFYLPTGAEYHETKKTFFFKEGSTCRFRVLERESDAQKYQGHEYTFIGFEELGNWRTLKPYDMLKACLRSKYHVPTKRIRSTFNPGGPGHYEIKRRFIDPCPTGYKLIDDDKGVRMFIPARVEDNRILLNRDPHYIERLMQVGSPQLVRAWLLGDFNAIEGSFFPEFGIEHIIEPFTVPSHWQKVRAYDHGYAVPFAVLWGAISSGKMDDGSTSQIPPGSIVIYREWYGSSGGNAGLRIDPHEIAKGIKEREVERVDRFVADPAIFKSEGGPSIAEQFYTQGISWKRADNARLPGWLQVRLRLKSKTEGIYVFSTCTHLIELMPLLQHSITHPEDADTTGEDHIHDTLRYLCMTRRLSSTYKTPEIVRDFTEIPFRELVTKSRRDSKRKF